MPEGLWCQLQPYNFAFSCEFHSLPQHLTRAFNRLEDVHVPAAVQSWIIFVLVL